MKIKKLTLENVTCFEKLEIPFNHLTLITGKNYTGKTTIVDALEKTLTGKSERNLLRDGAKTGNIIVEIDDFTLQRGLAARSQSLEINGFSGPMTDVQNQFLSQYKLDPDKISAILDPISFLEFDEAKKQSILASLLNLNFDLSYLLQLIKDENVAEWLQSIDWRNAKGLNLLDSIYQFAYQKRRDANRDVKTLAITIPQIEFPETLVELEARRAYLTKEQTLHFTSVSEIEKRKKAIEEIKKAEEAIKHLESTIPKVKGDIDQLRYDRNICQSEIDQLAAKKQTLSNMESPKAVQDCPIFLVPCPLPPETFQEKAKERQKAIKEIDQQITEKEKVLDKLLKKLEKLEVKESVNNMIAQHRRNIDEFKIIVNEPENIPISRPIGEIQKEAEVVNRKIAELQAAEKQKANQKALEKAKEDASLFDTVTGAFDPKAGIKAHLLKNKIGTLAQTVNQALGAMCEGYSVEIVFEPETEIRFLASGRTLSADSLSSAEEARLGIVFQYAFSLISGAKILVIDRADIFDYENRTKLSGFLTAIAKNFDSIILLYTHNTTGPVLAPKEPWISVYYLEDGGCREIKA